MVKIRNQLILLIFIIILGCASVYEKPLVSYRAISIPELNKQTTVSLGDRLISQAHGISGYSIELGSARGAYSRIKAGTYCQVTSSSNVFITPTANAVELTSPNGQIHGVADFVYYNKRDKTICPPGSGKPCYSSSEISISENPNGFCAAPNSFQQIIEYNGKNGGILNFTYREFQDNLARNAFTTNFTMDLSEGDTIAYKGAIMKIKNATNNYITYIVLKNFNTQ
ncbi:hypothetical protein [Methylotuvimicrobium sp. KM2]|uniref:hypothetical protein n=1 Tax=Methylotuvimicrobium sp. KM2 TaxID=3133976 RepID=UPI0031018EE7